MIQIIELRNFQSHRKTLLELSEGVNVITGPSDSGKTAIIRALRKLVYNRPLGDAFRSTWGGSTRIKVITTDGQEVIYRDNDEKSYMVGDLELKAFGTDVPQEVQDTFNIDDINLQMQLDQPFLLTETPGTVATHFNKVAKLDKIDTATANVKKWITKLTNDIEYNKTALSKQEEELKQYAELDKFETELEVLEQVGELLQNKQQSYQRLENLKEKILSVDDLLEQESDILQIELQVTQLLAKFALKTQKQGQYTRLWEIMVEIKEKGAEMAILNTLLPAQVIINNILPLYTILKQKQQEYSKLDQLLEEIDAVEKHIEMEQREYESYHTEFEKNMGTTCILCGQPIKQ